MGLTRNALDSWWNNSFTQSWLLEQSTTFKYTTLGKTKKTVHTQTIMTSSKLEGILATALSYNQSGNLQSIALRKRIESILKLIEQEMDKKL